MGAPCISLKQIAVKLGRTVRTVVVSRSTLFIVPSLATTIAFSTLFSLLDSLSPGELNVMAIIIMASTILSIAGTAGIQFAIYKKVDEDSPTEALTSEKTGVRTTIALGVITGIAFSVLISLLVLPYFIYVVDLSTVEILQFVILLFLFSIMWVLTAALWASGKYKYPALLFTLSYAIVFALGYLLYRLSPEHTLWGFIAGIAILLVSLALACQRVFRHSSGGSRWQGNLLTIPKLMVKEYWGVLFQTSFILAIFLDKIIVWVSEGTEAGNGLQVLGPYTTGAFLALVPALSGAMLAYFTDKVKPLSKNFYIGTLHEVRRRIDTYKRFYTKGLVATVATGILLLALVLAFSVLSVKDAEVSMIVLTLGIGVIFFEVILYNSNVLPAFGKSHVSTISVMIACLGVVLAAPLISIDVWYISIGFLVGSFVGFLISHYTTTRMLSQFEYNAFRAFQTAR